MTVGPQPIRVAVVEDHPVMREATVRFIDSAEGIDVAVAVDSVESLLAHTTTSDALNVVVLDLNLPGLSGLEGLPLITARCPSAAVLVLTMSDGNEARASAALAGARGFLTKGCAPTDLVEAVRTLSAGGVVGLEPPVGRKRVAPEPLDASEEAVLRLLVAGKSVGDIATQLGVSFRQGALLIASIKDKTGCTSRSEWLQFAVDHDLL